MNANMSIETRPRPLQTIAGNVSKGLGMVTALVVAAAGYGIISVTQGSALEGLLGAIPGVLTAIGNVLIAFKVATRGEPKVTPLLDPRSNDGQALLPGGIETRGGDIPRQL